VWITLGNGETVPFNHTADQFSPKVDSAKKRWTAQDRRERNAKKRNPQ
jgi:hypothetical protein